MCSLCVSMVGLGWPSPSALWPLWPSGSGCGLSICLLLSESGGTGAMEDPPHPSQIPPHQTPSPAPRPAAQAPESAQRCQVGPLGWASGYAVGPLHLNTRTLRRTHTHTHTIPWFGVNEASCRALLNGLRLHVALVKPTVALVRDRVILVAK